MRLTTGGRIIEDWIVLFATLALTISSGCGPFRLHDAGRRQVAEDAVSLSTEIRGADANAFDAMEMNIATVARANRKVAAVERQTEMDTLLTALPSMTADQIADRLVAARNDHMEVLDFSARLEAEAVDAAADAISRVSLISEILNPSEGAKLTGVESALKAVQERLDNLDRVLGWLRKAAEKLADLDVNAPALSEEDQKRISAVAKKVSEATTRPVDEASRAVKAAQDAFKGVEKDEQVRQAKQLLVDAGEQILLLERERLSEVRRHLQATAAIREELLQRHDVYVDTLLLPTLAVFDVDAAKDSLNKVGVRADGTSFAKLDEADFAHRREAFLRDWTEERTLSEYVALKLTRTPLEQKPEANRTADERGNVQRTIADREHVLKAIASIGLLVIVESRADEDAETALTSELHRHSIRLSKLNAQQRLDLVHQTCQGLLIYYTGGVKPEEVAQLILLGAQTAAIVDIAADK